MGVDVQIHIFLTSALVGRKWSTSRPGRITPGERAPGTYCIGGWVDLRAGLDVLAFMLQHKYSQLFMIYMHIKDPWPSSGETFRIAIRGGGWILSERSL
jgi:hypothetical protein